MRTRCALRAPIASSRIEIGTSAAKSERAARGAIDDTALLAERDRDDPIPRQELGLYLAMLGATLAARPRDRGVRGRLQLCRRFVAHAYLALGDRSAAL